MNPYSLDAFLDYLDHRRTPHMAIAPTIDCTLNGNPSVIIPADMFERLNREHAGNADLRAALEQERQKRANLVDRHAEARDRDSEIIAELRAKVAKLTRERNEAVEARTGSYWAGRSWADEAIAEARRTVEQHRIDAEDARANAAKHADEAAEMRRQYAHVSQLNDQQAANIGDLREELEQYRAITSAAETIKRTGGAVEIAGVRIEPCDEYGTTETTRSRDQATGTLAAYMFDAEQRNAGLTRTVDALIDQADADAELIDRLAKERDRKHREGERLRALLAGGPRVESVTFGGGDEARHCQRC